MRKLWIAALSALVLFALAGCGKSEKYEIEIIIPAGSQAEYVYADEEISPTGKEIEIWTGAGFSDTAVVLKPVEVKEENAYEPAYLTHGTPVKMDVEKGAWFQIGVSVQNPSDADIAVSIEVEGVEVRINQEFEEDTLLTEYLSKNYHTDSIASIMDAKEEYWDDLSAMDGHRSVYNQMIVMAENKEMWVGNPDYANDLYQYAVTDLDHNGRHEIIVVNHGGTGRYTYSRFFEINENYDGLTECETDFVEGDSQPDIISAELTTYIDDNGEFHYVVYDILRNGATEYYENYRELVLKEGKITLTPIAYRTTIYGEEAQLITCEDSEGNTISEEDFINAPKTYFAGYQETVTKLGWRDVNDLETEPEKIVAQLQESVEVYAQSGQ